MDVHTVLLFFHIIGVALGVGGATISDLTFLRAIQNKVIDAYEYASLRMLSRVVWAGIIILFISGHGFLLDQFLRTDHIALFQSSRFLAKYTLVWIVLLNGLIFHFKIFPIFSRALNKDLSRLKKSKIRLMAVTGAISTTSWYSIVVLSIFPRDWTYPYWYYIAVYAGLLAFGIISARFVIGKILKSKK